MPKIRVLPDILANKIAAGEVVERPASVAKELVENALDAGATRVDVEIAGAGRGLVRVADNGEGMGRDDAILAFERHATSKLRTAEDLAAISTFGFRGEALPSIAAVSRLTLSTRAGTDPAGTQVTVTGGRLGEVRDIAWPGGTEIAVRDLFFNMPARRKFLKSDATECYHVANLVTHYAIANPSVAFTLVNSGRETIRVSPVGSLRERAYQLLGPGLVDRLVEVDMTQGGMRVSGYVSNPQEQRTSREAQYLFVNGRYVRDRLISRAIAEAYRSMMPAGTYPAAIILFEIEPERLDVNAHPAKIEVRFREEHLVRQVVSQGIRDALERATRPTAMFPRPASSSAAASAAAVSPRTLDEPPAPRLPPLPEPRPKQSPLDLDYRQQGPAARPPIEATPLPEHQGEGPTPFERRPVDEATRPAPEPPREPEPAAPAPAADPGAPPPALTHRGMPLARSPRPAGPEGELSGQIRPLGQIRESFIVATDDEGLLLIDQHVAHERILFERFRDTYSQQTPARQQLLIPETIDLSPAQAAAFERLQPELEAAGFDVLTLSGRTVAVSAVPAELPPADAHTLLTELLETVEAGRGRLSLEAMREEIAASLACRAAIKINMTLTEEKMRWLIDQLLETQNPWTCPHGRPVILRFTIRDIERQFLRP